MIKVVKFGSVLPPPLPLCAFIHTCFSCEFDRMDLGMPDENEAQAEHSAGLFNLGV